MTARPAKTTSQKPACGLGDLFKSVKGYDLQASLIDDCVDLSSLDGDQAWEQTKAAMARTSCAYYAQENLTTQVTAEFPDGQFVVADHHIEWDRVIGMGRRINCILAARGHGKSLYWTYAYPIWKADKTGRGSGCIFSASQEQASEKLNEIKQEIEENPKLRHLLPSRRSKRRWGSKLIELANGHKIYARGWKTRARGIHPDWIVLDDALNDETMYSETVRKKDIDYFVSAIVPMMMRHTQIVVVGTPFFDGDLYTKLESTPGVAFFKFPALDALGNALWPDLHSLDMLEEQRVVLGEIAFAREYLCQPIADAMSLFPAYLFVGEPVEQPTVRLGMPWRFWADLGITSVAMGVDFALSASVKADYTVIWTMGEDGHGNRWIMDIRREHGLEYQHQLSLINEVARLYRPSVIYLESNQMQRIFGDELVRTTDLPIIDYTTGAEKNTLDKGVPGLRILLENRKIRIPRGDEQSVRMTNLWRDEMKSFTWKDGKLQGVGSHDDTVMAFWLCEKALEFGGLQFGFDGGDTKGLPVEAQRALEEEAGEDAEDDEDVPW